jgi:large subunit ribosomal protein L3
VGGQGPLLFLYKKSLFMNIAVAKKLNMSNYFSETGKVFPVTVLYAPPVTVTQVKTKETKDKYEAIQVSYGTKVGGSKHKSKAVAGHLKGTKSGGLTEFRVKDIKGFENGQSFGLDAFKVGELVNVVGNSKGRGFAGVMKRHGFAGFPASHGHDQQRRPGSIGGRYPQHTVKGKRMAGHMGTGQVTVKNLQVIHIDAAKHLVALKGAVPGSTGGIVKIVSTGKVQPLEKAVDEKDGKKK